MTTLTDPVLPGADEAQDRAADERAVDERAVDDTAYGVVRARLATQAAALARRAGELDARRQAVFHSPGLRQVGMARLLTAYPCRPRDLAAVGGFVLFGHDPADGRGAGETDADETGADQTGVFSVHRLVRTVDGEHAVVRLDRVGEDGDRLDDGAAVPGVCAPAHSPAAMLADPRLRRDLDALHRYYRGASLTRLRRLDTGLLAVFQTGTRPGDVRVMRWRLSADGGAHYVDDRGERANPRPPSHDVTWTKTTRDDHVPGRRTHVSVVGEVFVSTTGGRLTVLVRDDTRRTEAADSGFAEIYAEPVDEPLQSLVDAEVSYARTGPLVLLRVRPYKEDAYRYLVFNTRSKTVVRLDGIGPACRTLPDEAGVVFPGGYHLATGTTRLFDTDLDLEIDRVLTSATGEDVLYVFRSRIGGGSLLLSYNVIRQAVSAPLRCDGYALFDDGTLLLLNRAASDGPARAHPVQVWQTPYLTDVDAAAQATGQATAQAAAQEAAHAQVHGDRTPGHVPGPLHRVGNVELVRGVADCLAVVRTVEDATPSAAVFEALAAECARAFDRHHWLADDEFSALAASLRDVGDTARRAVEEFARVRAQAARASAELDAAHTRSVALLRRARAEAPTTARGVVDQLAALRHELARLASLRELRHVDVDRLETTLAQLDAGFAAAAGRAVAFLARERAFDDYTTEVDALVDAAASVDTLAGAGEVDQRVVELAGAVETVVDLVEDLDGADVAARTTILSRLGDVFAGLNRARAVLGSRRVELADAEKRSSFAAEFALLSQAVASALAVCDSPARCEEQLGRLLLRVEDLEDRFGDVDEFGEALAAERDNVHETFSARRQALLDERARNAARRAAAAARVLAGVRRRAAKLSSLDEVAAYFTTDPMVVQLGRAAEELRSLDEPVRAAELETSVAAARQEAVRALRDRLDMYADGGATLRLGRHRFPVNRQPVELALVPHGGRLHLEITGTDYSRPVADPEFEAATGRFWAQPHVCETAEVYRAEYLAVTMLLEAVRDGTVLPVDGRLAPLVTEQARGRYDEGYTVGVHDADAAAILRALLPMYRDAGLLRFPPAARGLAHLFWTFGLDDPGRARWSVRASALSQVRAAFGSASAADAVDAVVAELAEAVEMFAASSGLRSFVGDRPVAAGTVAARYLFEAAAASPPGAAAVSFVTSSQARQLLVGDPAADALAAHDLAAHDLAADKLAADDLAADDLAARYQLVDAWFAGYVASIDAGHLVDFVAEATALRLCGDRLTRHDCDAVTKTTVEGLLGTHPRVVAGRLDVRLDEVLTRVGHFATVRVPAYRAYQKQRAALVARERDRLALADLVPSVLSGFVRNRLVDEVYLPLVGDNLARQLGAVGETATVDRSGLLLLLSPPGYGKTTLMEYVAARLGILFVRVDGTALGHGVHSVDPAGAPDAAARREVEKISFALAAGSNTLLYLDDVQHTSPELLQRFVSLCDAQRRMDGVEDGQSRTYDLRGKRFAICLAGNPYTESGGRFRIPDMLANRADVWNLGEVLSGREALFALSHLENALTSNPVLAPLAAAPDRADLSVLVALARGDSSARVEDLRGDYRPDDRAEIVAVLRQFLRALDVVLAVNQAYVGSASQSDDSRTEPPFRLQGSYRTTVALARRISAVTTDGELDALVDDHYAAEAATLTSDAEANLLKLAELRGRLSGAQARRWTEVKAGYLRGRTLGHGVDPIDRAVGAVALVADRVAALTDAVTAVSPRRD